MLGGRTSQVWGTFYKINIWRYDTHIYHALCKYNNLQISTPKIFASKVKNMDRHYYEKKVKNPVRDS